MKNSGYLLRKILKISIGYRRFGLPLSKRIVTRHFLLMTFCCIYDIVVLTGGLHDKVGSDSNLFQIVVRKRVVTNPTDTSVYILSGI